jgi:hypothetical protein
VIESAAFTLGAEEALAGAGVFELPAALAEAGAAEAAAELAGAELAGADEVVPPPLVPEHAISESAIAMLRRMHRIVFAFFIALYSFLIIIFSLRRGLNYLTASFIKVFK